MTDELKNSTFVAVPFDHPLVGALHKDGQFVGIPEGSFTPIMPIERQSLPLTGYRHDSLAHGIIADSTTRDYKSFRRAPFIEKIGLSSSPEEVPVKDLLALHADERHHFYQPMTLTATPEVATMLSGIDANAHIAEPHKNFDDYKYIDPNGIPVEAASSAAKDSVKVEIGWQTMGSRPGGAPDNSTITIEVPRRKFTNSEGIVRDSDLDAMKEAINHAKRAASESALGIADMHLPNGTTIDMGSVAKNVKKIIGHGVG